MNKYCQGGGGEYVRRRQGRDLRGWMEQALRAWLGAGPMPSLLPGG